MECGRKGLALCRLVRERTSDPVRDKQEFVGEILELDAMIKERIFYFNEREIHIGLWGAFWNEGPQG